MGSFNTTCFVTRQTVAPGDACKVMPIHQQRTYNELKLTFGDQESVQYGHCHSTCYSHRFWQPVSGFFDAVYADYGRFTLTDTPGNRNRMFPFLVQALHRVPLVAAGENQYHDLPCDLRAFMTDKTPELLTWVSYRRGQEARPKDPDLLWTQAVACWDYLYEVAQKARLFWADYSEVLRPAGFAVMHTIAYDELVARTASRKGWSDESFEMREFFRRALAEVKTALESDPIKEMCNRDTAERNLTMKAFFAAERLRSALARVAGNTELREAVDYDEPQDILADYLGGKLSEDDLFEALRPSLEARYACGALEALNLHFEPLVYAGQDYSNEIGVDYAELVSKVSAKVRRAQDIHHYGEFRNYSVLVRDLAVFDELSKQAGEYDAALNLLSSQTDNQPLGCALAIFECTLLPEDMVMLLEDFEKAQNASPVLRDTLTELSAA